MHIPEGYKLVPVEPTVEMLSQEVTPVICLGSNKNTRVIQWRNGMYKAMIAAAQPVELPAYDEAAELAACRAHWEKNPNCLFSDMWLGWKACAQSRDGSVSDE